MLITSQACPPVISNSDCPCICMLGELYVLSTPQESVLLAMEYPLKAQNVFAYVGQTLISLFQSEHILQLVFMFVTPGLIPI